jgi:hypothetical protein
MDWDLRGRSIGVIGPLISDGLLAVPQQLGTSASALFWVCTRKENEMTDKPVMEMTHAEFDAAIRGFAHRAQAAQQKAVENAFMEGFFQRNPDLRPKPTEPTDPPATPDPAVEPRPQPVSTSSKATPPPPKPLRATSALDMSHAEWERALARINSTGQLP